MIELASETASLPTKPESGGRAPAGRLRNARGLAGQGALSELAGPAMVSFYIEHQAPQSMGPPAVRRELHPQIKDRHQADAARRARPQRERHLAERWLQALRHRFRLEPPGKQARVVASHHSNDLAVLWVMESGHSVSAARRRSPAYDWARH